MPEKTKIQLPEEISVRTLASLIKQQPTAVISKLIKNGVMANINQNIDYDTAALLVEDFGFEAEVEQKNTSINKSSESKDAVMRPPIVTIMGHVDHGKTSLLDYIRSTTVAAGESGGITQHISAYQIDFKTKEGDTRKITFVDTPGHEAFSALRAHGASLTDIVILVVAADDGVKPQTLEALKFAREANVEVLVAINKTDLPGSNAERVKQQLSDEGLVPEQWGGKTVMLPVSAKTGEGVDALLDMLILTADLLELKADPDAAPEGIIIEGKLDKQIGPISVVLVYNGTLHTGQVVVVGKTYGRIRTLEDENGNKINTAGPARPVRLIGLKDVPSFGDRITVVPNEKVARSMTQTVAKSHSGAGEDANTINIVLKADVGGSLAALEDSITKLKFKDATVDVISSGIGPVNENDVNLAKASHATVISFRLPAAKRIIEIAEKEKVAVKDYWIIYDALDFLQAEIKRIATPVYITTEIGRLKVLEVFSQKDSASIVGGEVTQGEVAKNHDIIIYRNKEEIGKAKVSTMKIGKVETDRAEVGVQCGMSIEGTTVIEKGDFLAFVETKED